MSPARRRRGPSKARVLPRLSPCRWLPAPLLTLPPRCSLRCSMSPGVLDLFGPSFDVPRGTPPLQFEHAQWQRLLRALGGRYAALASVPPGVWEDLAELRV